MTSGVTGQKLAVLGGPKAITGEHADLFGWPIVTAEDEQAVLEVLRAGSMSGDDVTRKFEAEYAAYQGCEFTLSFCNGTAALMAAMYGCGVRRGDEIIAPSLTYWATALPVFALGATVVFAEIEADSVCLDPKDIEHRITPRTKTIVPVHYCGHPADMDPIMEIARSRGVPVIEDACQAHGAEYKGRRAGSIGIAAAFSFYPGKNLGACGEAGAIVTNDSGIAQKVRILRDHGQEKKYVHAVVGWNARMDGIQGAILSAKLKHIEEWNERRRRNARKYSELLTGLPGVILPIEAHGNRHVYHIYAIRVPGRDSLMTRLREEGVNCAIHYPVPIHLQKAYDHLRLQKGSLPITERYAEEFLSLPMFPELTQTGMEYVSDAIRRNCN